MIPYVHEDILGGDCCGGVGARLVILAKAVLAPGLPLGYGSSHAVFLDTVVTYDLLTYRKTITVT